MNKTNEIVIRNITMNDIPGIMHIHRSCEDPWREKDTCTAWISKRIDCGFYMQAAVVDEKVAGHGEWVISDEPDRKYLYLGMLQIDDDYQFRGIGRKMIADGIRYAKNHGCNFVVTLPETDNTSIEFYKKCGFKEVRGLYTLKIRTEDYKDYAFSGKSIEKIPFEVIKEKKFMFEKCQISSHHMWQVQNELPSTDTDRRTPAVLLDDGSYIQLSYFPDWGDGAFMACWSNANNYEHLIKSALALAYSHGRDSLEFYYLEDEDVFDGFDVYEKQRDNVELIYNIEAAEYVHTKIDIEKDRDYIFERHCRINYECDCPWARKTPYDEYRSRWFSDIGQQNGFLSALEDSMRDERTIAEIIKTESGEVIAYLWAAFHGEDSNFIWSDIQDIYVEEAFRGMGIASYLIEYAEKSAKLNGAKVIRSGTGCENFKSVGLHEKAGYYQYRYEYEKVL